MDLGSVLRAPITVPVRLAHALDDLAVLADRARREPDPVEQVRARLDLLLAEIASLIAVAREIVDGGQDLTRTARSLDATARQIVSGGDDLNKTGERLDGHTVQLVDGGADLTAAAQRIDAEVRVLSAALPRILDGLETVDQLEGAVETVAETIEPLQGTAERVGRVTERFSRRRE